MKIDLTITLFLLFFHRLNTFMLFGRFSSIADVSQHYITVYNTMYVFCSSVMKVINLPENVEWVAVVFVLSTYE